MGFARIVTDKKGNAHLEDVDVPDNVRLSEEKVAKALLDEKDRHRNPQLQALVPTPGKLEHAPAPYGGGRIKEKGNG